MDACCSPGSRLTRVPLVGNALTDALTYADQTAGPLGERLSVAERLAEAIRRHGPTRRPLRLLRARRPRPYVVAGWEFPVVYEVGHRKYGGPVDATVTGLLGFRDGIYYQSRGDMDPPAGAIMLLSRALRHADSGCLVIDVEGEAYGHTHPYILYQGMNNLGRGNEGMGPFIAQAVHRWDLETCHVPDPDPIQPQSIG